MAAPRRENDPKRKPNLNQDPYDGGEDPNWDWTSEKQNEIATHYENESKKKGK